MAGYMGAAAATFESIAKTDPKKSINWLAFLSGLLGTLSWISLIWTDRPGAQMFKFPIMLTILVIIGGFLGIVALYFGGWLYRLTGSWLGGKGGFTRVRCALGWGNYPFIVASVLNILSYLAARNTFCAFFSAWSP